MAETAYAMLRRVLDQFELDYVVEGALIEAIEREGWRLVPPRVEKSSTKNPPVHLHARHVAKPGNPMEWETACGIFRGSFLLSEDPTHADVTCGHCVKYVAKLVTP